ncbi:LAGLIDADG family homing endonuclease [Methylophaga thiooxydans]|uniref:LAGLIDADG family homing endonuclease n=1 Tax=Methylophaga thiooxydans TaxID=392484 RepID=UPI002356848F|nr:LAGLIDADG family homing endonuclease [Methylophaga thiooxydans]
MSDTDIAKVAWAAGFIDGEGCIHIMKQKFNSGKNGEIKYSHILRVHIAQNNLEVLEYLREVLGLHGNIHKLRRTIDTNRQGYTLNYSSSHAFELVKLIKPYLIRKLPEAEAVVAFWKEGKLDMRTGRKSLPQKIWGIRERWYRKLKRMK